MVSHCAHGNDLIRSHRMIGGRRHSRRSLVAGAGAAGLAAALGFSALTRARHIARVTGVAHSRHSADLLSAGAYAAMRFAARELVLK